MTVTWFNHRCLSVFYYHSSLICQFAVVFSAHSPLFAILLHTMVCLASLTAVLFVTPLHVMTSLTAILLVAPVNVWRHTLQFCSSLQCTCDVTYCSFVRHSSPRSGCTRRRRNSSGYSCREHIGIDSSSRLCIRKLRVTSISAVRF